MSATRLHHLVVGPPQHGVTRHAEQLLTAAAVPATDITRVARRVGRADLTDLLAALPVGSPVHVHVTDHLFGAGPEEAAEVVAALAVGRGLTATLHDLPQPSDGAPYARRCAGYAAMVAACRLVVVGSDHEDQLLSDLLRTVLGPAVLTPRRVVPLPVDGAGCSPGAGDTDVANRGRGHRNVADAGSRDVAVLGFVYPGKGHEQVLAALDGLPDDVGLRVLGGASPGHEWLVERLNQQATAARRRLFVAGWLDDAELAVAMGSVVVPVFAPRHVSASASLMTWLAAGRRPVTTSNRYTEEVGRRLPGALLLVEDQPDALREAVRAALEDPALTRLGPGRVPGLSPREAAACTFEGADL